MAVSDPAPEPPPGDQLSLFPGVTGLRSGEGPPGEPAPEPTAEEPAPDSGQLELFADYVVLARDLDVAISDGRFEEAVQARLAMADALGLLASAVSVDSQRSLLELARQSFRDRIRTQPFGPVSPQASEKRH